LSRPNPIIDLHTHSTSSDGTDSPSELVARAASIGLSALGLTDHDTIGGLSEAKAAAIAQGIDLIPGIELSIEDGDVKRFHLLSYFFDAINLPLTATLESVRRWRSDRNTLMLDRAKAAGVDLTLDDVRREAGADATVIGRPHFAHALMKKGLASSVSDAFDRYLSVGRPLHVAKPSLTPQKAAQLLHGAGGVTVLAHPGLIKWADRTELAKYVAQLKSEDVLDGIECYYFRYDEEQTSFFLKLAKDLGLLVSGGSDFHGDTKPDVPLGNVYRGQALPIAILDPLREAAARRKEAIPDVF
jgi:predicted metal-dependent phosphoesterase TrpH